MILCMVMAGEMDKRKLSLYKETLVSLDFLLFAYYGPGIIGVSSFNCKNLVMIICIFPLSVVATFCVGMRPVIEVRIFHT